MANRIILLDWSYFVHCAIKSKNSMLKLKNEGNSNIFILPATYTACSMVLSNLKKIGLDIDDKVIFALDLTYEHGSWRKDFEIEYKGNRQKLRDNDNFVDWKTEYTQMNGLREKLDYSTPFYMLGVQRMEADDIIAMATEFYKDKECIIISPDHDFDQLLYRDNVKIFSPHTHPTVKKCPYRILDLDREKEKQKALASVEKKISKEVTDNLINPILNQQDYDKRRMLVDLLSLPDFVSEPIKQSLTTLTKREYNLDWFPFRKMKEKFNDIYAKDKIISYEYCRNKLTKKLK